MHPQHKPPRAGGREDLAGHIPGFTATGGYEGEAKQRPRVFHHQFPTLPTLQIPEQFQTNKQDPMQQIHADYQLIFLGYFGTSWHLPNTSHVLQGTMGPPARTHTHTHTLRGQRVAAGQGWVISISLQQCIFYSRFHLRGHGWDWEQLPRHWAQPGTAGLVSTLS